MGKKTINQALKDLFLGLGGKSSDLDDNTSVSDYIEDLESAIKETASGGAEAIIDDESSSESKTYSSSKIESLISAIPENSHVILCNNTNGQNLSLDENSPVKNLKNLNTWLANGEIIFLAVVGGDDTQHSFRLFNLSSFVTSDPTMYTLSFSSFEVKETRGSLATVWIYTTWGDTNYNIPSALTLQETLYTMTQAT